MRAGDRRGRERPLTDAQRAALRFVDQSARRQESAARARTRAILDALPGARLELESALESVRRHARVAVHFHPDRYGSRPITVAEGLLTDGCYRNQFETGLSAGSRSAFPGGSRDRWERELFGGAYHTPGVLVGERPKYGALDLIRHPDGPTPRFGSCRLLLADHVKSRTTFTFGGSEHPLARERLGTNQHFHAVLAALLEEVARGARGEVPWPPFSPPTLGLSGLTVPELVRRLVSLAAEPEWAPGGPLGRVLDSAVEAHVHGSVSLLTDVDHLVVDPAFRGTETEQKLSEICSRYRIALRWHPGFRLALEAVPEDFRGPAVRQLAHRIASDGYVDAAVIGRAEASLRFHPVDWQELGTPDELLQQLKQLWHVVVHYGAPILSPG